MARLIEAESPAEVLEVLIQADQEGGE
jgi:hypothetical protein